MCHNSQVGIKWSFVEFPYDKKKNRSHLYRFSSTLRSKSKPSRKTNVVPHSTPDLFFTNFIEIFLRNFSLRLTPCAAAKSSRTDSNSATTVMYPSHTRESGHDKVMQLVLRKSTYFLILLKRRGIGVDAVGTHLYEVMISRIAYNWSSLRRLAILLSEQFSILATDRRKGQQKVINATIAT